METPPMVTETIETRVCVRAHTHAHECARIQSCFGIKALQNVCSWENEVFYWDHRIKQLESIVIMT